MVAKCVKFYEFGNPLDVLTIENKPIEGPLDGELLVRMVARPINPSDLIPIKGSYANRITLPTVPGYEGVGVVEEVGSSVPRNLIGRRVLPLRGEGTWQEFVKTKAELAIIIPDSIDDDIASQLYINPITAWLTCTEILQLQPGDVLLVNACGSAIGRIFAQLAKIIGFRLIAVTRNDNHTKELLALGASDVINTAETSLYQAVMDLTNGKGVDSAIDSIGGIDGTELAFCVRSQGTFLTIGLLSGIAVDWKRISQTTNINVKLFHLRHWNQQVSIPRWQKTFQQLIAFIHNEKLSLMKPSAYYDLSQVKEAIRAAELMKGNKGKIMLTS